MVERRNLIPYQLTSEHMQKKKDEYGAYLNHDIAKHNSKSTKLKT